ncbi:hypothetical protein FBUS_00089 [Fasciolopsis buskii]|uniref:LIM zinc-binding domain-containing protein n=1 Tax=Fasciolopsis buskii TaxID=27845 RepID=A0A8E0RKI6_9TREM|nr:hypothetical protein FBUS_00089 [Fasciolopsis buski]
MQPVQEFQQSDPTEIVTNYHVVDGKPHCDPPCPEQLNSMSKFIFHCVEPQREYCSACGLIIATNLFVRAFDGVFHNECFRCSACNRLLSICVNFKACGITTFSTANYQETQLKMCSAVCSLNSLADFARLPYQHACFLCQRPVSLADRLDRLNRTYHRNCFRCHKCHRLLQ